MFLSVFDLVVYEWKKDVLGRVVGDMQLQLGLFKFVVFMKVKQKQVVFKVLQ